MSHARRSSGGRSSAAGRRAVPGPSLGRAALLVAAGLILVGGASLRADRLILRDVSIITGVTVTAFDVDGVTLSDGRTLRWDLIDRATVAEDKQAAFDASLKELGEPLFRVRQRLETQDYANIPPLAEPIVDRYRASTGDAALMVYQALAWGRIARGRRAAALAPTLHVWRVLAARPEAAKGLPGPRRVGVDPATGLDPGLPPVWTDKAEAEAALADTYETIKALPRRPEAAFLGYASLQIAAGQADQGLALLKAMPNRDATARDLATALRFAAAVDRAPPSDGELSKFAVQVAGWKGLPRSVGLYHLGLARLNQPSPETAQQGAVDLLTIPALEGDALPELSAAALAEVMQWYERREQSAASIRLRKEILGRFGGTTVAAGVRAGP